MKKRGRLLYLIFLVAVDVFWIAGCSVTKQEEKVMDCDYTVVEEVEMPNELVQLIEEKKTEPFRMSYEDAGYIYICVGYGKQIGGGYSISVDQLYETKDSIEFKTTLIGPKEQERTNAETYPYIVVKMEKIDKEIVYLDEK